MFRNCTSRRLYVPSTARRQGSAPDRVPENVFSFCMNPVNLHKDKKRYHILFRAHNSGRSIAHVRSNTKMSSCLFPTVKPLEDLEFRSCRSGVQMISVVAISKRVKHA